MGNHSIDLIELLADGLCIFSGDSTDVQCMNLGPSGDIRHTGNAGNILHFINSGRINRVSRNAQRISNLLGQQGTEVCGMVAMQGNGQIMHDGIIDGESAGWDWMQITASANTGIQLMNVIVLFLQIIHDDLIAEIQLIDGFLELFNFRYRVVQADFHDFLFICEDRNLGGSGARIDYKNVICHMLSVYLSHMFCQQGGQGNGIYLGFLGIGT